MKAIRVERPGGREVLACTEVAEPSPVHGQVLVAIEFAGVNFIDVYQREGLYPVPTPAGKILLKP
jgi:NADPH2:quinone reductase